MHNPSCAHALAGLFLCYLHAKKQVFTLSPTVLLTDVNECLMGTALCFNGATCRNHFDGYECECTNTWMGDYCEIG